MIQTTQHKNVKKTTFSDKTLNRISFVGIDTETADMMIDSVNIGFIIYSSNPIEINPNNAQFTIAQKQFIKTEFDKFLESQPIEETNNDSMEETYSFINANFYSHY
jgi:hypothetical protein